MGLIHVPNLLLAESQLDIAVSAMPKQDCSASVSSFATTSFTQLHRGSEAHKDHAVVRHVTVRFGSTAKVLAECKLKYYRISECM